MKTVQCVDSLAMSTQAGRLEAEAFAMRAQRAALNAQMCWRTFGIGRDTCELMKRKLRLKLCRSTQQAPSESDNRKTA